MKTPELFVVTILFVSFALAKEKAPLPKDLPAYGTEKPSQAPAVKATKLENGLMVWLVSEPGFPKVSFSVAMRGGMAADPADRPGISELLSKALDQGTKSRTAKQIAEEIQAAGGDIDTQAGKDAIVVSTSVLSSKTDGALTVLADVLENASFPDNEVALAKRNLADSLRQREAEPSFLAARAMARVLFGDNPYHVTAPTQESVEAATSTDLRRIYGQRFRPDQAILVAVGDFENDKMTDLLHAKLAAWKAPAAVPVAVQARFSTALRPVVSLVPRPNSVQTTLWFGTLGPLRSDPDYEAADVANAIYGGTFGSRLVSNIREDKGYTYAAFGLVRTYRAAGVLITRADVRNEVTPASVNEMTYELNRLATTSPTEEELATAKRYLVGVEAIQLQSRASVAGKLANLWVLDLPPEEIGAYGQKVASITAAQVDTAARKYFPASRAAIVVVGEEKIVRDAFELYGLPVETLH
jgi:zinc protease